MDRNNDKISDLLKELDNIIKSIPPKPEKKAITGGLLITSDRKREKSSEYTYEQAMRLVKDGKYSEAIICLEGFLEANPGHGMACNDLGVLYLNEGNKEKALYYLKESVVHDPVNLTARKNLGDIYLNLGELEEGLQIYMKIIEEKPDDIEALIKLGEVCEKFERHEGAKLFYKKALKVQPENGTVKERLKILSEKNSSRRNRKKTKRNKKKR
ncbi:MAG: tetratricopeptide repeat protein [Candidatus Eremiobacterota bacterium]